MPVEEEVEEQEEGKAPTGKALREKLEETLTKNAELTGELLMVNSGLAHLTPKQRKAVLRDVQDDGKELSADTLKAAAKDLGYNEAKETRQESKESGEDEELTPEQIAAKIAEEEAALEGDEEPLDGFEAIERATRKAGPSTDPQSFEYRLNNAKTREEAESLIKKEGFKVGLVHEDDLM